MLTLVTGELAANLSEEIYLIGVNSWGLTFHNCNPCMYLCPFRK